MPSWQARVLNTVVRAWIRRRDWGDERALTRRARRVFGAFPVATALHTRGLERSTVVDGVRGEWLTPPDAAPGAILYCHGGGYVSCSPATHRPITAALARLSGLAVFSLDYRLAPEHRFPAAADDAFAAYRWLLNRTEASTIALAGDSAGGALVLTTLVQVRNCGMPLPACGVCFSPWADLAATGESARANDGRCAMFHYQNAIDFAAVYLGEAAPTLPAASPVYADLSGLPPLLLQVGSTEILLDDARRVHEQVQRAGGSSTLQVFDDVFHVWQMLDGIVPEARVALRDAATFIRTNGAYQLIR